MIQPHGVDDEVVDGWVVVVVVVDGWAVVVVDRGALVVVVGARVVVVGGAVVVVVVVGAVVVVVAAVVVVVGCAPAGVAGVPTTPIRSGAKTASALNAAQRPSLLMGTYAA